jgi:hypothetical protein
MFGRASTAAFGFHNAREVLPQRGMAFAHEHAVGSLPAEPSGVPAEGATNAIMAPFVDPGKAARLQGKQV